MRSYDASGIEGLPVPVEWIAQVVEALRGQVDDIVIIGAAARDVLASHAGGLPIQRVTKDLDVAVAVSGCRGVPHRLWMRSEFAAKSAPRPSEAGSRRLQ